MKFLIGAVLAIFFPSQAVQTPSDMANSYHCASKDGLVMVHFTATSMIGKPTLALGCDGVQSAESYSPQEVFMEKTRLGTLLTVSTKGACKRTADTMTLILPAVSIDGTVRENGLETTAFLITEQPGEGQGPGSGAGQADLSARDLTCRATSVVF